MKVMKESLRLVLIHKVNITSHDVSPDPVSCKGWGRLRLEMKREPNNLPKMQIIRLFNNSFRPRFFSLINDVQGLSPELFFDDARASPAGFIHDMQVMNVKSRSVKVFGSQLNRRRLNGPMQQIFREELENAKKV
jgi:hypothetical protein